MMRMHDAVRSVRLGPAMASLLLAGGLASSGFSAVEETTALERRAMVERALNYLVAIQKEGMLGESRPVTVAASFVLACLSSGYLPDHPEYGASVRASAEWILLHGSESFLGGQDEPMVDHAMATLMLSEVLGLFPDPGARRRHYDRLERALDYVKGLQDNGVDAAFHGGWRRNTRANDRMLTAWILCALHSAQWRGLEATESSVDRAAAFMRASQKTDTSARADLRGGFSLDADGLPVSSATAAGLYVLSLGTLEKEGEDDAARLAVEWLGRHPPRWYGPNFYETHFFSVRGLYRLRRIDEGKAFRAYFARLTRMLRERQESDGRFPFPPGHGGPITAMGSAYSTAMAILILNVDRGVLPLDR